MDKVQLNYALDNIGTIDNQINILAERLSFDKQQIHDLKSPFREVQKEIEQILDRPEYQ